MMHSVLKKASWGTQCVFGGTLCKKQASLVRKGYSVQETPSYGTELALGVKKGLLRYATHFQRHSVLKNRLLRYGRDIRYRKPPSTVRNEATGCGHCVASSDLRICHCVAGSGLRMRLLQEWFRQLAQRCCYYRWSLF